MCAETSQNLYRVADYLELIQALHDAGFSFAVIGGCAVGSYARLIDQTVLSGDLDVLTHAQTLHEVLHWMPRVGAKVLKRPQPRTVPAALVVWQGKEVNLLSSGPGLPRPDEVLCGSRIFRYPETDVYVADPFVLLANKLQVRRPKDLPHIEVLRRFLDSEVELAFVEQTSPRERIEPAQRLLAVTHSRTLDLGLWQRLFALARTPVDFRFLLQCAPDRDAAEAVMAAAPAAMADQMRELRSRRRFERRVVKAG